MDGDEARRLESLRSYRILDTPPEPNFDRITALAATIFELPICTLALADRDRHWFKSKHGVDATEMPRRLSFCDETLRGDGMFVVEDAFQDARFNQGPIVAGPPHLRFYAGAPLVTPSGARIGSLCVLDTAAHVRFFSQRKQAILVDLASTAVELLEARARQIELTKVTDEIAHLARHDPLTGLANRRRLRESLDDLAESDDQAIRMALLYLDLDGFKAVNDRYGHLNGDDLLREVAGRLTREVADAGMVARLGGDEFAILLIGRGNIGRPAAALADRLIGSLARSYSVGGALVRIGASIGLAVAEAGQDLNSLLRAADEALYRAKAGGRGRLVIASGSLELARPAA